MAKKKSNKRLTYIIVSVVLLIVGFIIVGKSAGWIGKKKLIEVNFEKAKKSTVIGKVSASGKIQPEIEVKVAPEVSGEIIELNVREGDSVVRGQLLLKIRPDRIQSVLEQMMAAANNAKAMRAQAEANLSRSEAQYLRVELDFKRQNDLYKQKVISNADMEQAEASYQMAKQDLESARENLNAAKYSVESAEARVREQRENLNMTKIYAPSSGIISKLGIEKGERVVGTSQMAGTELLRIANLQMMEVLVAVNENDIIKVEIGDTAIIDVDSYSSLGKKFKGIVTSIANTAKQTISSDAVTEFEVKIRILNESFKEIIKDRKTTYPFRPGMTASVEIITDQRENVLTVPLIAVTTRNPKLAKASSDSEKSGDKNYEEIPAELAGKPDDLKEVVFVHENGKAKMVEVKIGINDFENIEILEGLKEGDEIIAGPYSVVSKKMKDGDEVTKKVEKVKEKGK